MKILEQRLTYCEIHQNRNGVMKVKVYGMKDSAQLQITQGKQNHFASINSPGPLGLFAHYYIMQLPFGTYDVSVKYQQNSQTRKVTINPEPSVINFRF